MENSNLAEKIDIIASVNGEDVSLPENLYIPPHALKVSL